MEMQFVEVPPPSQAPIQPMAETLGLVPGLRAEESSGSQWRCSCCSQMQRPNAIQVWVPDFVRRSDPEWSITEACRQNAYNGSASAWCVDCAPKAKKRPPQKRGGAPVQEATSFWVKLSKQITRLGY